MSQTLIKKNIDLSVEELVKENAQLKVLNEQHYKKIKIIDKKIQGLLWFWWFLPIIGWIVYNLIISKRRSSSSYNEQVFPIKKDITLNEIQIIYNEELIKKK